MITLAGAAFVIVLAWSGAVALWHILWVSDGERDRPSDDRSAQAITPKPPAQPERRTYDARDDELALLCGVMVLAGLYIVVRWGG